MAILNQNSQSQTFFSGWYGTCETECQNLNISTSSFRDKIYKIYQIRNDNLTYDGFDGVVPPNLDGAIQVFTEFECGKAYIIILKSGTGQVNLPHFKEVNNGSLDAGRVTQNCAPAETYDLSIVNENLEDSTTAYPHNENESLTFKLTTTGLNEGDTVAWEISGSNITLDDFVGLSSLTGNFTLDVNGESLLPIQLNEDLSTENAETFRLRLVNQTDVYIDVPIDDTSQTPHTYLLEDAGNYSFADENDFSLMTINLITTEPVGNFIPFTVSGSGITLDDFSNVSPAIDSNLQGNFEITGTISGGANDGKNYGQVAFNILEDSTTEGTEVFTITLDDHQSVSFTIDINDTSTTPPTYTLSSNLDSVDEGTSVTITLETTDVDEGVTIPFTVHGSNITIGDFSGLDSLGAGEFVIDSNGDATFSLEIKADSTTEGPETFTVTLDDHPSVSVDVDINDTSTTPPTYTLSSNLDSADEGTSVTITLETTDVSEGEVIPFTIHGSNITIGDFSGLDSLGAGEFVIDSNGNSSVNLTLNIDSTTEGPETFTVTLDDHPSVSIDIDINDTSKTPPTYTLSSILDSADEGTTVSVLLETTDVDAGDHVGFTVSGLQLNDFVNPPIDSNLEGNFLIENDGTSIIEFQISEDLLDESESFTLTIDGTAESIVIFIVDATFNLSSSSDSANEGDSVSITLSTTNLSRLTEVPFTISGVSQGDFINPPFDSNGKGSFILDSNGDATIDFQISEDLSTEEFDETLRLTLDNDGQFTEIVINDTSFQVSYTLNSTSTNLNEGDEFTVTLDTLNVPDGTVVPFTVDGSTLDDFDEIDSSLIWNPSNSVFEGSFTVGQNNQFVFKVKNDETVDEGNESISIYLNNIDENNFDSITGKPVVPSSVKDIIVNISDTSRSAKFIQLTSDKTTLNETQSQDSSKLTLTCTGQDFLTIVDGQIEFEVVGTIGNITSQDFNSNDLGGYLTVQDDTTAVGELFISADSLQEGEERFRVRIVDSPEIQTDEIIILDTSIPQPVFTSIDIVPVDSNDTDLYEGKSFHVYLNGQNLTYFSYHANRLRILWNDIVGGHIDFDNPDGNDNWTAHTVTLAEGTYWMTDIPNSAYNDDTRVLLDTIKIMSNNTENTSNRTFTLLYTIYNSWGHNDSFEALSTQITILPDSPIYDSFVASPTLVNETDNNVVTFTLSGTNITSQGESVKCQIIGTYENGYAGYANLYDFEGTNLESPSYFYITGVDRDTAVGTLTIKQDGATEPEKKFYAKLDGHSGMPSTGWITIQSNSD